MVRIILGVIVGFIVWSVLWLGTDQVLILLSPGWYGAHQHTFQWAMMGGEPFTPDATILGMHLIRALVISLLAGFITAFTAGENGKAPPALGGLLLICGAAVQAYAWNYIPLWYHAAFLILLVPATVLGGLLRGRVQAGPGR